MSKKPIGFSTIPKYETNPFVLELKGKMFLQPRANTIIARGQSIVDTQTGEIIDDSVLVGRRKIVDKSQFAKIYASEIGTLYDLSKRAQNVFLYLTKVMDYDNRAYFNYFKDYHKLNYKNHNPCYKALLELINSNIIASDIRENTYWLNPKIVCKGERFASYTEYITKEYAEKISKEALFKENVKENLPNYDQTIKHKLNTMQKAEEKIHKEGSIFDDLKQTNPYKNERLEK